MADSRAPNLKARRRRGNATLYVFSVAVAVYYAWFVLSDLPPSTLLAVGVPPLLVRIDLVYVGYLPAVVLAWFGISAFVSLENLPQIPHKLLTPVDLIASEEIRDFFSTPVMLASSVLFLLFISDLVLLNTPITIRSSYELLVEVPPGQRVHFTTDAAVSTSQLRLASTSSGQLVGLAVGESAVLVLRDKYNLTTLDLICVRRHLFSLSLHSCIASADPPVQDLPLQGVRRTSSMEITIYEELRWARKRVDVPMRLLHGHDAVEVLNGWIEPGEPRDGPETPDKVYAQRFLARLYAERFDFSDWTKQTFTKTELGDTVFVGLGDYELRVVFSTSTFNLSDLDLIVRTRDATRLAATEL
jgi:hypothetical protein